MANHTLTTGTDIFPGTGGTDDFQVTPATLTAGDIIGTIGQQDNILMSGDGTYDFRTVTVAGIYAYFSGGGNVTIHAPNNGAAAVFILGPGASTLYGGVGTEWATLATAFNDGADYIDLDDGNDTIDASDGHDFLGDTLIGGAGNDFLLMQGAVFDLSRAASITGVETFSMTNSANTLTVGSATLNDVVTLSFGGAPTCCGWARRSPRWT